MFVGRVVHWGLAYGGEAGVLLALDILRAELEKVLVFSGCRGIDEVGREYVLIG